MTSARVSSMARVAGRGFFINVAFTIFVQGLLLVQGLLVPRLLGPEDVGLFALAMAAASIGITLKSLGTAEKLVQERHADLPLAYSVAFTLEIIVTTSLCVLLVAGAPLFARYYDEDALVPIIAVLALSLYAGAFISLPSALFQRRLQYLGQNVITALGPVVGFAVTVPMALAGFGVWSLVVGAIAPLVVGAPLVAWSTPLRPRLRLHGPYVRSFLRYGWPLWTSRLMGLASSVVGTVVISRSLGIAALGFFSVAQSMGNRALVVDTIVGQTIFPALCRAQDDAVGQRRAFAATNRVTAMWSATVGLAIAVFAEDVIRIILGAKWAPAEFLFQLEGLSVVTLSIGWSWDIFYRARGETKPTLAWSAISEAWVFVVLLPCTVLWGLTGAAWAVLALGVIALPARQLFLRRIFPGVNLLADVWRELLAVGSAALVAAIARAWVGPPRTFAQLGAMGIAYCIGVAAALLAVDRTFLFDVLRRVRAPKPAAGPVEGVVVAPTDPHPVRSVTATADDLAARARVASADTHLAETMEIPGEYPLWVTPGHDGSLWMTLRDSSSLARLDTVTNRWDTWRLPAYPHVAAVDDRGRAWVALTLASSVAVVDPTGGKPKRVRLGRTRELLVAARDGDATLVVDSGRRCIWRIDGSGHVAIPLPSQVVRPDFVATTAAGAWWVTDTHAPVVAHRSPNGAYRLLPVPSPTRTATVDERRGVVWLGHWSEPLVSRFDLGAPEEPLSTELPGVPFGATLGPDGRLWLAIPDEERVVAIDEFGISQTIDLPRGSGPGAVSVAWVEHRMYVAVAASGRLLVYEPSPLPA